MAQGRQKKNINTDNFFPALNVYRVLAENRTHHVPSTNRYQTGTKSTARLGNQLDQAGTSP
jgi:hypothetical protein